MTNVAVIDYGVGNLLSVSRALEYCGACVSVTSDPDEIRAADRVVLPGVGSFANGMAALEAYDLTIVVKEVASSGTPLLGICLGMQMLFDESEEFGTTAGLGLISGRVVKIPPTTKTGEPQNVPHIGWNELVLPSQKESWRGTVLANVSPGDAVYFVHSFMAVPASPTHRLADCNYGDMPVAAVVGRDNVVGCQFHPEKSGEVGLTIMRRFVAQPNQS